MTVSIIVNFYKSEKFIKRLLDSIFEQTYTDWELICVNDCSPGNDTKVIKEYVQEKGFCQKVRILENEVNLGVSLAKKRGVDNAKGEYLFFMDGDDFIEKEALSKLVKPALDLGLDLVFMNYYRFFPIVKKKSMYRLWNDESMYNRVIDKKEFIEKRIAVFLGADLRETETYWGKLYKTEIVKNIDFEYPDKYHMYGEDYLFNMEVYKNVNTAMFIDYAGYNWRWGGISSNLAVKEWSEVKRIEFVINSYNKRKELINIYNLNKYEESLIKNILFESIKISLKCMASKRPKSKKAKEIKDVLKEILENSLIEEIQKIKSNLALDDKILVECMLTKDVDAVYEIGHSLYLEDRKYLYFKRWSHKILDHFRWID